MATTPDEMSQAMGPRRQEPRRRNVRTAVALVSVALVFFLGVIVAHMLGAGDAGLMLLGALIVLFLVFAIGRNLFDRR